MSRSNTRTVYWVAACGVMLAVLLGAAALTDYRGMSVISDTPSGPGGVAVKDNFQELARRSGPYHQHAFAPASDDDGADTGGNGAAYQNSLWLDTTISPGRLYLCIDHTTSAAVWRELASPAVPGGVGHLAPHPSNPVFSGAGAAFLSVFKVAATWHAYGGTSSMYHWTSSDGVTWSAATEITNLTASGVASAWYEVDTYYMLYRMVGTATIGLATSTDGTTWTPNAGNPVLTGTAAEWDDGVGLDPWGLIKVGSTYYLFYNTITGTRGVGVATSTDLVTWVKDANNPIFTGGRFCACYAKLGPWYYAFVAHYTSGTDYSEIEVYRDRLPTFLAASRQDLGVVKQVGASGAWDDLDQDTPWIVTDNVQRDSFTTTNGQLWCYFAGNDGADWKTGLLVASGAAGSWNADQVANSHALLGVDSVTTGTWSTVPRAGINAAHGTDANVGAMAIKDEVNAGDSALAYTTYWDSAEDGTGTTGRLGFAG